MACLALPNLPLLAASGGALSVEVLPGKKCIALSGWNSMRISSGPVVGLMDLHLDPYCDINLPDESFSS